MDPDPSAPLSAAPALLAGAAAHHPATTRVAADVLRAGGSAADAAVAALLAACVGETVLTGLAGGGHALVWDAQRQQAWTLDFFCAVPSRPGPGHRTVHEIEFGGQTVPYECGAGSVAVHGVPAGAEALWRAYGRLPWRQLVAPALNLARTGVVLPAAHARVLAMLREVLTLRRGAQLYEPGGRLLEVGDRLQQPGLVQALELLADRGAAEFYSGSVGEAVVALCEREGGLVIQEDLASYEAHWGRPEQVEALGVRLLARRDLLDTLGVLERLDHVEGDGTARGLRLASLLEAPPREGTTNVTTVDADGNVCVVTSSMGLGAGLFLDGLDVHLNSMYGETELLVGDLEPGQRMGSMMTPLLALDDAGPVLAAGAAGGSRIRSAMVHTVLGVLRDGLTPQEAIDRPRLHRADQVVHVEPGLPEDLLAALEASPWRVARWRDRSYYFGGVSAAGRAGLGSDPRRSGTVERVPTS